MIAKVICPRCWQPNEASRLYCWQCSRLFKNPATREEYERRLSLHGRWSQADLKLRYHQAAMASHPDKHPGDTDAVAKFQFVNQAYEALSQFVNAQSPQRKPVPPITQERPVAETSAQIDQFLKELQKFYGSRFSPHDPVKAQLFILYFAISAIVLFGLLAFWSAHFYNV